MYANCHERSIPAGAGEPISFTVSHPYTKVYPRGGGGTLRRIFDAPWTYGLSPRGRGNQGRGAGEGPLQRSIPAGAGEPGASLRAR